jgi:hypothetical protein
MLDAATDTMFHYLVHHLIPERFESRWTPGNKCRLPAPKKKPVGSVGILPPARPPGVYYSILAELAACEGTIFVPRIASILGVSEDNVYDMCNDGQIPWFWLRKKRCFDPQTVAHWLRKKDPNFARAEKAANAPEAA